MSETLLVIQSSISGENSKSNQVANAVAQQWQAQGEARQVVVRDVGGTPHLDSARFSALITPADQLEDAQKEVIAFSDELIAEVMDADAILLLAPMYNFTVPTQLKSYFDHLTRANITFRYTETGAEGLIENKPVYILATRGGMYHDAGLDFQIPWVKQILGFMGLEQVEVVLAEGLSMGDPEPILEKAQQTLLAKMS